MIQRNMPALYVENDRPEKSDELIRWIAALGYRLYHHHPRGFSPNNFAGRADDVFGNLTARNLLCVSEGATIEGLERVAVPA